MTVCSVDCKSTLQKSQLMLELLLHFHNAFRGEGIEMVLGDKQNNKIWGSNQRADKATVKIEKVLRVQLQ